MKDIYESIIVFGVMTGLLLPVRLLFVTFVSDSWMGSFGVISVISISILILAKTGKGLNSEKIWHVRKDGTKFLTSMDTWLLRDSNGKPAHMCATAVDITDQKLLEDDGLSDANLVHDALDRVPSACVEGGREECPAVGAQLDGAVAVGGDDAVCLALAGHGRVGDERADGVDVGYHGVWLHSLT